MNEMSETGKAKKYALIAAICFVFFTAYRIIDECRYIHNYNTLAVLAAIVEIAGFIGLTVAAFIRNRKILLAAACVCLCAKAYWFYLNISSGYIIFGLLFLGYAALAAVALLSLKGVNLKYLWFIPALLIVLRWMYISKHLNFNVGMMFSADYWFDYTALIVESVTFFFAGLWLKAEPAAGKGKKAD